VSEQLRTEPDAVVEYQVLPQTVPFDAGSWHTQLAPGTGGEHLELPA
jgi:hypothetical protein